MENTQQTKPDAIIFLPGLGDAVEQDPESIARRIANALDRRATTGSAKFTVKVGGRGSEYAANPNEAKKEHPYTVSRHDGGEEKPLLDVYTLSYVDTLSKKYLERNLLQQWLHLFFMLFLLTPRVFRALLPDRQQIRPLQKIQVLFALFILTLSVVYLVVLTVALVGSLLQVPQIAKLVDSILNTSSGGNLGQQPVTLISQIVVILLAVVELFYPQLKQKFSIAAVEWISAIEYINAGTGSQVVAGQLANLLEHVVETNLYRNIHIIAYSLGSVIAIDSFFPRTGTPGPRLQGVNTLVTIACPYDVIRLFWPEYFEERTCLSHTPQHWLNIYSPVDIMGSNFRDDSATAEPNKPIQTANHSEPNLLPDKNIIYGSHRPDHSSFIAALTLVGLTSHATYWEAKYQGEESAFSPIIQGVYEGDFALS